MSYSSIQISDESMFAIVLMIITGIVTPLILVVTWNIRKHQKFSTTVVGAASFIIFALVLESIPRYIFFQSGNTICKIITDNIWLYSFIGALLAAIFEETARYISFKYFLKKQKDIQASISYGLGHGGCEMIYILFFGGIQNLAYAMSINSGKFQNMVKNTELSSEQLEQLLQLPSAIASISLMTFLLALIERISALLLQISCSIIVYKAIKDNKNRYLVVAMLIHFLIDFIIVFYNKGIINSIVVFEGMMLLLSIMLIMLTTKLFYKRDLCIQPVNGNLFKGEKYE